MQEPAVAVQARQARVDAGALRKFSPVRAEQVGLHALDVPVFADALRLFPPYLDGVEKLVKYVDGWNAK